MYPPTESLESYLLNNREGLLGFIRSKVNDDALAEDILQDSLLKALQKTSDLNEKEKLVPWFYRIIRNAITDAYRRHSTTARRLERYLQEQPTSTPPPEDTAVLCNCFEALLPTLKPEYTELIEAMDLGGATTETMTERLGITPNNLKVRHYRARQQLRERLEETCRTCAEHGCVDCTCNQ